LGPLVKIRRGTLHTVGSSKVAREKMTKRSVLGNPSGHETEDDRNAMHFYGAWWGKRRGPLNENLFAWGKVMREPCERGK